MTSFQKNYVIIDIKVTVTYFLLRLSVKIWVFIYPLRNGLDMMAWFEDLYLVDDVVMYHYELSIWITYPLRNGRVMMTSS